MGQESGRKLWNHSEGVRCQTQTRRTVVQFRQRLAKPGHGQGLVRHPFAAAGCLERGKLQGVPGNLRVAAFFVHPVRRARCLLRASVARIRRATSFGWSQLHPHVASGCEDSKGLLDGGRRRTSRMGGGKAYHDRHLLHAFDGQPDRRGSPCAHHRLLASGVDAGRDGGVGVRVRSAKQVRERAGTIPTATIIASPGSRRPWWLVEERDRRWKR
mmetsp:Transcript_5205/g.14009  ORF Transcript_5205/g.14009 Transcript_5205/m.14009 type:complete len:214 (+) Transcript_5205:555-1196(+)